MAQDAGGAERCRALPLMTLYGFILDLGDELGQAAAHGFGRQVSPTPWTSRMARAADLRGRVFGDEGGLAHAIDPDELAQAREVLGSVTAG